MPYYGITHQPGERFGRLTVLRQDTDGAQRGSLRWLCRCDCGQIRSIRGSDLRNYTRSCGCLIREASSARRTGQFKYGVACRASAEYRIWTGMHQRCRPTNPASALYAARGITICPEWASFERFLADMGARPSPSHSIDRIDNDGPYAPWNCRWATRPEQGRNKRSNHLLTFDGLTLTLTAWSERIGISRETLARRVKLGWPTEQVLTTPVRH
jgi:hypothetical protein